MERSPVKNEGDVTQPVEEILDFDDAILRAIAEVYKNEGNNEYQKKEFGNAIFFYTRGIKVKCKDDELNAKLYNNRAIAYSYQENHRESLNDAKTALKLNPTYIKAIERGARACVELKLYEEAISWCDKGLIIEKNSKTLLDLKTRCANEGIKLHEKQTGRGQNLNRFTLGSAQNVADWLTQDCMFGRFVSASLSLDDFKKCTEHHELLLTIAKNAGDRKLEGIVCEILGLAYYKLEDLKKSMHYLKRHLEIAKEVEDKAVVGRAYCELGTTLYELGDLTMALDYSNRALDIAKKEGDKAGEGAAYSNLGNVYDSLGDLEKSIYYHELDLTFSKMLGDKAGEGRAYANLGNAHSSLKRYGKAIDYHNLHLKIVKELGNRAEEGIAYGNLGVAHNGLGDFKVTRDYHERNLEIAKEVGNRFGQAMAYLNLGTSYSNLGDYKKAIVCCESGLKIAKKLDNRENERDAYGQLGKAYCAVGEFAKAKVYHELELKCAKEMGDRASEGRVYGSLGNICRGKGTLNKAIKFHEQELKIAKEVRDRTSEGAAYAGLGNDYYCLGDYKKAIDFHENQLKIAREEGNKVGEVGTYLNLGNAHQCLGNFKKALEYFESYLDCKKKSGDKEGEGKAYGGLGSICLKLGYRKKAVYYHEKHLEIAKELGDKVSEGVAYSNLGSACSSPGLALFYHERDLEIAKDLGDRAGEGMSYGNIGTCHVMLGDFEKSIQFFELQLEIAKEVGNKASEGIAYANLGTAFRHLGDFGKAVNYTELDLKIAVEIGDRVGVAKSFHSLGLALESQGSLPEALNCYQSSVKTCNEVREGLHDEWKVSLRNMYDKVYLSLWCLLLKQDKVVEALSAAEQGRAQALRDLMETKYGLETFGAGLQTMQGTIHDTFASRLSQVIFIAVAEREIIFWICQNGKDVKVRRKEIGEKVNTFFHSLLQIASKEIGARSDVKCEDRSLDKLGEDTVADQRAPADQQTQPLVLNLQKSALCTLYDSIIVPIQDVIQGNELTFIPEGALCLAPYAAFMDSNSKYLCESFRIKLVPSLTTLKLITDCPADYHCSTGALLVGDPWVQDVTYQGTKLLQLPWAREEVQMIGRVLHTVPLIGIEATKEEVLKRLPLVALVHIAAHGQMETGEIALAPNPTRVSRVPNEKDFLLTMRDVLSVQMRARLVVLSCCHSARGRIMAEGVVGIARAFLGAGARSVVVSLWAIDDEATLEFMKMFYLHLVKGKSTSHALNLAMECIRESDKFSAVKYWAPFVLIGDDVTLEFDERD